MNEKLKDYMLNNGLITQRVYKYINENRVIDRICDITIYEISNIKYIKSNKLRCYITKMLKRNNNKVYKKEYKDARISLNLFL